MGYCSASDISGLTPHLLSGSTASSFTTSTSPTLAEATAWISTGCAIINAKIATKGYDPIGANSPMYEVARHLNAMFGAYMVELTRLSARVNKQENTRSDQFRDAFEAGLKMLMTLDLSTMGVSRGLGPPAEYTGGISQTDKRDTENDSDLVTPRFSRGMFDNREALKPDAKNADEQER